MGYERNAALLVWQESESAHQNRTIGKKLRERRLISQYNAIVTQQEIGSAIKERRKKLGINQQTLAGLASVAVNTVVAIERGEGNYDIFVSLYGSIRTGYRLYHMKHHVQQYNRTGFPSLLWLFIILLQNKVH